MSGESRRDALTGRQQTLPRNGEAVGLPPGSKYGACVHRGNPGTRESLLSPFAEMPEDEGYRQTKSPGVDWQHARQSASQS
jgi:hypothetical protein